MIISLETGDNKSTPQPPATANRLERRVETSENKSNSLFSPAPAGDKQVLATELPMLNPYESPTVSDTESIPTSLWRLLIAFVAYVVSLLLAVAACYGAYNLHSRGWPHTLYQTVIILLALGAFVVAATGFAVVGTGVRTRRRRFTWLGVAVIGIAIVSYFGLFWLAN